MSSMSPILFATGNDVKFRSGAAVCRQFGIRLKQLVLDIPEIQAADGEAVARDKALRAYEMTQKPVIISDDSWIVPGLNGFPGPFMKFVAQWLTPEDWLRLTTHLTDRRVILQQIVVYQDQNGQQLFATDIEGILLTEIRSLDSSSSSNSVVSLDGGKTSIAEMAETKATLADIDAHTSWHDLCDWLKK